MTGTEIRLYNTLTRQKEALRPFDPENVRMYVCGPTVYDFAHIGNARPVIVFDVLFRLLRHVYGEAHVTYVRNITDVDDKINARALRDHPGLPLNEAIRKVTETTANQFHKDVAALGNLTPSVEPRATDNIAGMTAMIQRLIDEGHAYVARGEEGLEVLFDVLSMPEYGGLSKRNLDEQQAGARIAVEAHKKNPADFVLWKESAADLPGWEGSYTVSTANAKELKLKDATLTIHGRPGWHIECSVMSDRHLWAEIEAKLSPEAHAHPHQFDIHGGGLDLIFPHHENEIAQSRCAHGTPKMAQIWMHNGFLQVEGQKMSKSLGNFFTINELLETENFGGQKWPGEVLRLAMLMTHYREPIDFSVRRLEQAESVLLGWKRLFSGSEFQQVKPEIAPRFLGKLADDLNTPEAVTVLSAYSAYMRGTVAFERGGEPAADNPTPRQAAAWLKGGALLLGLDVVPNLDIDAETEAAISARLAALAAKDFAKADAIRAELGEQGIQLMDYKDPETGERKTKWEVKR